MDSVAGDRRRHHYVDLPDFLIIGAAKCGTTALYHFVRSHPEVYPCPVGEPRFFSYWNDPVDRDHPIHRQTVTDLDTYRSLFATAQPGQVKGEASPSYLHNPKAPGRIRKLIPAVKLIAILRNPVDRAFSHFLHFVKHGYETTLDFSRALQDLNEEFYPGWAPRHDYISFGFYGAQLTRYTDQFPREQLMVCLAEDFRRDPQAVLADIFTHLGVDSSFVADTSLQINVSGIPRSALLTKWLREPSRVRSTIGRLIPYRLRRKTMSRLQRSLVKRPTLDPELRRHLIETYREDIQLTERLLGRDLSHWLQS